MSEDITSFRGPYGFLSNFYPAPIKIFKRTFASSEILYQALKAKEDIEKTLDIFSEVVDPAEAKRLGKGLPLKDNWDDIKEDVMSFVVDLKFKQNIALQRRLVYTQPHLLIEGNMWHDNFFGHCFCPKCKDQDHKNILGKILMKKRIFYTILYNENLIKHDKMAIEDISNIYCIDRETAEFVMNCL